MFQLRKSNERGHADHGWLKSFHTFSFADYHDPNFMGFGPLRVINEDFIQGGAGFPTHAHRDMEIITYLIQGALEHKDSTGSSGVIHPYEVQKMTAGHGIRHSEFNHLKDKETHLLQIWIIPQKTGLEPSYEQMNFQEKIMSGKEVLLVSPDGEKGSLKIHQDVYLTAKRNHADESWEKSLVPSRKYWLQVVLGEMELSSLNHTEERIKLKAGDALAIIEESALSLKTYAGSEFLFFDMR